MFEEVSDTFGKEVSHHPRISALDNWLSYHGAGRLPEAIALFERVRVARLKKLGRIIRKPSLQQPVCVAGLR